MLEGKEFEQALGEFGSAYADLSAQGVLEIGVSAKVDLIAELKKLALRSDNSLDDKLIEMIEAALKPAAPAPVEP
jgi:hypothetical protein